ncbi:MAG: c-type cytochrome [Coriobacteriia bacterium]|nr:c-type cytochrome [Coriobacteriia bacterium]
MKKVALLLAVSAAACLLASGCSSAAQTTSPPAQAPAASMPASAPATASTAGGGSMSMGSGTDSATPVAVTGTALVGQKIFLEGTTPNGPIKFTGGSTDVGNGACANCHGKNAGGGDGPMISWSMLSMKGSTMRNMPKLSYASPEQVVTAITAGTRPDGTKLKANMPRYQLSSADAAAVVDYLRALR